MFIGQERNADFALSPHFSLPPSESLPYPRTFSLLADMLLRLVYSVDRLLFLVKFYSDGGGGCLPMQFIMHYPFYLA